MVTQVDIKLDKAQVSFLSGRGEVHGLVVGNPPGFKTRAAVEIGRAELVLEPGSMLAGKIIVRSVTLQSPVITLEGGLSGNNLSRILERMDAVIGSKGTEEGGGEGGEGGRRFQVDEMIVSGAKVNLSLTMLGGKSVTLPLPEIRLANLGQGSEGVSMAELARLVLREVLQRVTVVSGEYLSEKGRRVTDSVKELGRGVAAGVRGLFNKK